MLPQKSLVRKIETPQVAAIVTRVFMLKNRTLNDSAMIFTANEMQKKLSGNYYYLTVEEVQNALEKGVFGYYGEYYEIGVVTMCNWLDAYLNSDERRAFVESHRPKLLAIEQKASVTKEEADENKRQFLLSKFNSFRRSNCIDKFAEITYKFLTDFSLINPTPDDKQSALARADKVLAQRKRIASVGVKSLQELFRQREMDDAKKCNERRITIAKQLLAEDFFRGIIANHKEDWLEEQLKKGREGNKTIL